MEAEHTGTTLPEPEFRFALDGEEQADWRVVHLHHSEGLSRISETGVLIAHLAPAPDVSAWMGHDVALEMSRGAGGRRICGIVRRVEVLGSTGSYSFVRIHLVPELWTLSLRQNSRVWQHVPVATVVRDVLRDAGLYQRDGGFDVAASVQGHHAREFCVQYKESDLAFVSRLLEEEGIPYCFKHDGMKESFALLGKDHAWPPIPTVDGGHIPLMDHGTATHGAESLHWFNAAKQMRPTGALLRDFDFTHPDATLDMTKASPGEAGKHVVYDYPARFTLGGYDGLLKAYGKHAGEQWAKVRGEQLRADAETAAGQSNVTGLTAGMKLSVHGHEDAGVARDHVVVSAEHHAFATSDLPDDLWRSERFRAMLRASGVGDDAMAGERGPSARYHNRFTTVQAGVTWRPQPTVQKPVISGPQTAVVMAAAGSNEEICVDEHGRILVRFHWERPEQRGSAQAGKNASCWARVAQSWAGAAWGAMFIPRVGMEVVVHFLDGDPDRPLVTGCVYNGKNHPPYELPANKTRSTFKSLSSPGGDGYNEFRFEDLKGKEQVWLHAERDHDVMVKHDATMTVGHDRTHTIEHDEHLTVFNDRATSVRRNDSLEVEGYRSVAVHGGGGLSVQVDARYHLNADAGVLITCGASAIEMFPDRITVSSKTVNVVGSSLVNINGTLVKINCDQAPAAKKTDMVSAMATKALSLMSKPGSLLDKLKSMLDPAKLASFASGKLGGLLKKLGIPQRITDRLTKLASTVVGELVGALKDGRKPNWGKLGEAAIGTAVGIAVGEVFRPLERLPLVQNNRLLGGLVREAHAFAEDAGTYGALHAAGLNEGMAADPFWQTMIARHGDDWKNYLGDVAKDAGQHVLGGLMGPQGAEAAAKQLEKNAAKEAAEAAERKAAKEAEEAAARKAEKEGGHVKGTCKHLEKGPPGAKHQGGKHGRVKEDSQRGVRESHHVPPKSVSPHGETNGPAISMDYGDHRALSSTGRASTHPASIAQQRLANAGPAGFLAAMTTEIAEIRAKYGNKYDPAIAWMLLWAACMGYIPGPAAGGKK